MSTMLNFRHGSYANLFKETEGIKNVPISNGTIYVTTDEKAMYVDLNDQRIRLGQIITCSFNQWQNLKPPYSTEAFYYIIDRNALLKYNDGTAPEGVDETLVPGWVQINSTADLETAINTLNTKLYGADGKSGDVGTLKTTVATLGSDLDAAEADIVELNTVTGYIGKVDALPASANVGDVCIVGNTVYTWVNDASKTAEGANKAGWKSGNESARIEALKARVEEVALAAGDKTAVEQLTKDVNSLKTDMTDVKDALSDGADGLVDVSAVKATADSALPKATFTTFQDTNTQAIANAKQEAISDAEGKVNALANGQVATNTASITDIKTALQDSADPSKLLDVSEIKATADNAIQKDGSVAMEANLNINNHKIINVATPELDGDAVNKSYVDSKVTDLNNTISTLNTKLYGEDGKNNGDINTLKTDVAGIKTALQDENGNLLDVSDIKATADAALPTATFTAFQNTNTQAIANAKQEAISDAEGKVNALANGQVKTNATNIADNAKAISDLTGRLERDLQAADAMTFEGTVNCAKLSDPAVDGEKALPTTGVNKGDTYKATADFLMDEKVVYIGDLLIATTKPGTSEEADGTIAADNLVWEHVPSGYRADYVPNFALTDGGLDDDNNSVTLNLTSAHAAGNTGDLGKITLSADTKSAITISSLNSDVDKNLPGSITIGMAWGTF